MVLDLTPSYIAIAAATSDVTTCTNWEAGLISFLHLHLLTLLQPL